MFSWKCKSLEQLVSLTTLTFRAEMVNRALDGVREDDLRYAIAKACDAHAEVDGNPVLTADERAERKAVAASATRMCRALLDYVQARSDMRAAMDALKNNGKETHHGRARTR